ncbi:hypothetical protein E2542_SST17777 [Spatholobus suberectus]|nr:hypothetical protein E2542_SST17777 [Spatholobus suberectus]
MLSTSLTLSLPAPFFQLRVCPDQPHFVLFLGSWNRMPSLPRTHDHYSPETPQPEFIEHYLHEELVQSEFNDSSVTKRD